MRSGLLAAVVLASLPITALAATAGDIDAYGKRSEQCTYWGGEEPYDRQRAEHIAREVKRLRCGDLEHDWTALVAEYQGDDAALRRLNKVKPQD